jgi:nucleotide-binding universal stress UspA family protein
MSTSTYTAETNHPDPAGRADRPPIVVGVDGSEGAGRAVRWAADEAARRRVPLRIVHVVDRSPYDLPEYPTGEWPLRLGRHGWQVLAEAERIAREHRPDAEVTVELLHGSPARVLRSQAHRDAGIVLGSRGLGGFTGALLGSVSDHVAGHASCPVVVVRPGASARSEAGAAHREIVVGVDGSPECEPALDYAFEEARLRGCVLRAVYGWQLPVHAFAPEAVYDMDEIRRAQYRVMQEQVESWHAKYPEVPVVQDARSAHPVDALVQASRKAELTVVGSHGRGVLGSAMLGSVSRGLLHHAHGPVAVVRS